MEDKKNELQCAFDIEESIDFEYYVTLFDPVRCAIIKCLAVYGEMNIKEIAEHFTQDRSVISRHLDMMHRHKIVDKVKVSRNMMYRLNNRQILEKFETTVVNLKLLMEQDC